MISRVGRLVLLYSEESLCVKIICILGEQLKFLKKISMSTEKLTWEKHIKAVCDETRKKKVNLLFYCTNIQNLYNFYMNAVDVVDQLRSSYGLQNWV